MQSGQYASIKKEERKMAEKTSLELAAGLFRNTDKNGNIYYSGKNQRVETNMLCSEIPTGKKEATNPTSD